MGGPGVEGWRDAAQQRVDRGPVNAESPPVGRLSAIRRSGCFRGKGTFR